MRKKQEQKATKWNGYDSNESYKHGWTFMDNFRAFRYKSVILTKNSNYSTKNHFLKSLHQIKGCKSYCKQQIFSVCSGSKSFLQRENCLPLCLTFYKKYIHFRILAGKTTSLANFARICRVFSIVWNVKGIDYFTRNSSKTSYLMHKKLS